MEQQTENYLKEKVVIQIEATVFIIVPICFYAMPCKAIYSVTSMLR
jgi:hypothetical protein